MKKILLITLAAWALAPSHVLAQIDCPKATTALCVRTTSTLNPQARVDTGGRLSVSSANFNGVDVNFPQAACANNQVWKHDGSNGITCASGGGVGDAILNSTQTWSGANTYLSSSVFQGFVDFSSAEMRGVYLTTFTYLTVQLQTTSGTTGPCVSGSTMTLVLANACHVDYIFAGMLSNLTVAAGAQVTFVTDGAIPTPYTDIKPMMAFRSDNEVQSGNSFTIRGQNKLSAGSHDFCFSLAQTGGGTATLGEGTSTTDTFTYLEVRTRGNCNE